ncbi:MAG: T9SS type A sorting domain-containing protein [Bacteroidota bacterium]
MKTIFLAAFSCWILFCSPLFGQGLNLTFETNAPNESFANHRPWENANIDLINGSGIAVWGTTLDDGFGNEAVYIQTFETPVSGAVNIGFDKQFQIVDPFNKQNPLGPTQFHALVEDGNQVVVAATRDWETVGSGVRFITIFSLERSSGIILWTQSLHFGDVMRMDDLQMIRDNAGDFVVAFNLESQLPKWGPVRNRSGIGAVKLDPNGAIQWVRTFRYAGSTYIPSLFRLTDLKQNQLSTGAPYVLAGSYSRSGPNEEAFVLMLDPNGLLYAGQAAQRADIRPGAEDYLSVAADGNSHYLSFADANQEMGLQKFDNNYNFSPTVSIIPPVAGKSQTLTRQIKSSTGFIDLMLEYLDPTGVEWSGGFGRFNGTNLFYREYDYAPGDKEAIPYGYNLESGQILLLSHPTIAAGAMGNPLPSYLRVLEGASPANACHPPNGGLQTAVNLTAPTWNSLFLVSSNKYQKLATKPVASDYNGMILDCNLNPFANYRVAGETDNFLLPKISLFPNPATSAIQLSGDLASYETLEVLDMTGRVVLKSSVGNKISIASLSPGIYHLRLGGSLGRQNLSFVKN